MKKYLLPVILLSIGAGIAAAASFAARHVDCCQSAKNCCEAKSACCETADPATVTKDCCRPVQDCCEEVGDCCGIADQTEAAGR